MGMSIEQAEKLLDDLATQEELLYKRADDASGYTRSGNKSIRTSDAKTHEQHAKEYRQILRYLAEYRLMQVNHNARPTAHWVERNPKNSKTCRLIECSECGEGYIVGYNVPFEQWIDGRNYCVHCGCKMAKENEDATN